MSGDAMGGVTAGADGGSTADASGGREGAGTAGAGGDSNDAGVGGASTVRAGVSAGGDGGSGGFIRVSWLAGSARASAVSREAGAAMPAAIGAGSNSMVIRPSAGTSASLVWLANVSVKTSKQATCARSDSEIGAAGTVAARPRGPCGRSATRRASPDGTVAYVARPE